jgi:hypothetical protein
MGNITLEELYAETQTKYNILINYLKILLQEGKTFIDREKLELILNAMSEEVE